MHVTHGDPAEVWLQLEDGTVRGGVQQVDNFTPPFDLDGRWVGEASFVLADRPAAGLPPRAFCVPATTETSTALIVTPDWLGLPETLGTRRAWGLATQLYSVRSANSWGVGDLTDLADLALWSASVHGADYVLVNPLHAAAPSGSQAPLEPMEPSPYLPTSRRFVNPLYLRVEAIPEFVDLPKRGRVRQLRDEVQHRADRTDAINRDTAWTAKRAALKLLLPGTPVGGSRACLRRLPRPGGPRPGRLRHLVRAGRKIRHRLASVAEIATASRTRPGSPTSSQRTRTPSISTAGCSGSSTSNSPRRSRRPQRAGMSLGIMHDLAVGVHPNGADAWALQDVLALG